MTTVLNKWKDLEKFIKSSKQLGGNSIATMGYGGGASLDAEKSTYSLMYIKMVAVFSDLLKEYCFSNGIDTSDDRLKVLLNKLNKADPTCLDFSELRRIREMRNDIAHKPDFLIGPDEFTKDKEIVKAELTKLFSDLKKY